MIQWAKKSTFSKYYFLFIAILYNFSIGEYFNKAIVLLLSIAFREFL